MRLRLCPCLYSSRAVTDWSLPKQPNKERGLVDNHGLTEKGNKLISSSLVLDEGLFSIHFDGLHSSTSLICPILKIVWWHYPLLISSLSFSSFYHALIDDKNHRCTSTFLLSITLSASTIQSSSWASYPELVRFLQATFRRKRHIWH